MHVHRESVEQMHRFLILQLSAQVLQILHTGTNLSDTMFFLDISVSIQVPIIQYRI
jgi:hypothetical protein